MRSSLFASMLSRQNSADQRVAVSQHKQLLPISTVPCAERNIICSAVPANSIQQSPSWQDNRFSASQEIPRILRNPKVHCRIHKSPSPVNPEPGQSFPLLENFLHY